MINPLDIPKKIEYLEEERKKIWERMSTIEKEVKKKPSDYEKEAKEASRKASQFRNRTEDAKKTAESHLSETHSKVEEIKKLFDVFQGLNTEINDFHVNASEKNELINKNFTDTENHKELIQKQLKELDEVFASHATITEKMNKLEEIFSVGDERATKISTLYNSLLARKKEIDQLHKNIFGFEETDESGEETKVKGVKDELESSYNEIKNNLDDLEEELSSFKDDTTKGFDDTLQGWNLKYLDALNTIKSLLPGALTSGLSHAYSIKKKDEVKENKKFSRAFDSGIVGLVIVSLIPFYISFIRLNKGVELEQILMDLPKLVLSILPLYIPLFWVAYAANKKLNLSKRLIEEYSHKEALSKTFEGLSTQINSIGDKNISDELRTKLLYNVLEVSSENPGKLISDYNTADHPLMDALDKSMKLTNSINKLSIIPGFTTVSNFLEKKTAALFEEESKKVEAGLAAVSDEKEAKLEEK